MQNVSEKVYELRLLKQGISLYSSKLEGIQGRFESRQPHKQMLVEGNYCYLEEMWPPFYLRRASSISAPSKTLES